MAYVRNLLYCVWGTKNRIPFITLQNKEEIFTHIRENARKKGIFIDFINGHCENLHCIISLNADMALSKAMQLIKGESSIWINRNKLTKVKFEWADEYFAVSISESQLDKVREYIKKQDFHHQKKSWEKEYQESIHKYKFGLKSKAEANVSISLNSMA